MADQPLPVPPAPSDLPTPPATSTTPFVLPPASPLPPPAPLPAQEPIYAPVAAPLPEPEVPVEPEDVSQSLSPQVLLQRRHAAVPPSSPPESPTPFAVSAHAPLATPQPVVSVPQAPTLPVVPQVPRQAMPVPPQIDTAQPTSPPPAPPARHTALFAVLALVIILFIAGGSSYALALSGVRVPLLYHAVSSLDRTGIDVSSQAVSAIASKSSYEVTGESSLRVLSSLSKPTLPTSDSSTTPTTLTSLHTTLTSGRVDSAAKTALYNERLAVDGAPDVPVYIKTNDGVSSQWQFYLPANLTASQAQVDSSQLRKTLLYPALQPLRLSQLLKAVIRESTYQKKTVAGVSTAVYDYDLTASALQDQLPEGSVLVHPTLEMVYAWKTALPLSASLQADLQYQSVEYTYTATWKYGEWSKSLAAADAQNFAPLLNTTVPAPATGPLSLALQLGIISGALPTSLSSDTTPPVLAGQPISPSGESTDSVNSPISTVPPVPATPATDQMKQRDVQRKKDLSDLQSALERYKTKQGSYPASSGLEQTISAPSLIKGLLPTYLTKLPLDPLKDTYWYEYNSDGHTYTLRSVAENSADPEAKKGKSFSYLEKTNP